MAAMIVREQKPRERLLFDINRRQSEIVTEFSRKASCKPPMRIRSLFENAKRFKKLFWFCCWRIQPCGFSELVHTIKSLRSLWRSGQTSNLLKCAAVRNVHWIFTESLIILLQDRMLLGSLNEAFCESSVSFSDCRAFRSMHSVNLKPYLLVDLATDPSEHYSDFIVCTSSDNSSTTKPKSFFESHRKIYLSARIFLFAVIPGSDRPG